MIFEDCAELIRMGYLVVPIPPGSKAPLERGWQRLRIHDHLERWRGHGVGFLCGVGKAPLLGLDIDVTDEPLSLALQDLADSMLGPALVRVGQAPKALLLYGAAEAGWPKVATAWWTLGGAKMRVEALGLGQQFVAYGVHPGTGRPYEWTDMYGGAIAMPAAELTTVSREVLRAYLEAAEKTAQRHGCEAGPRTHERLNAHTKVGGTEGGGGTDDPLLAYEPPVGVSIDQAREALRAIDAAEADYDTWVTVGMALHHESGGDAAWHALWDEWCVDSGKFVQATGDAKWRTFGRRTTGRPVTMRTVLKLAADARGVGADAAVPAIVTPGLRLRTELGNAWRMVDRYGSELRWCAELGAWLRWTGVYWRVAHETEMLNLAAATVEALWDEARAMPMGTDEEIAARADAFKWAARSQTRGMCAAMVGLAAATAELWVRASDLDAEPMLLGVQNGAVDLRTGELRAPDAAALITRVAGCSYERGAPAPVWRATVLEVFKGNPVMADFFQRLMGYIALGMPVEDLLVILYGTGNNGKSTLMDALRRALGAHATMTAASTFLREGGAAGASAGGARPDVLALAGARLAVVTEPEEGGELREALVKSMTGGESIPARALYSGTIVQVQPTWTAVMATNHRPIVRGDDTGIWRRLLLIAFERDFDRDGTKDVHREARLLAELPGILWWVVEGALAYQAGGLQIPAAVDAARREYRGEMDLLADWLNERCVVGPTERASLDALWADWEAWAKSRGELRYIASRKSLSRRLQNRACVKEYNMHGTAFWGLRLRENLRVDE